MREFKTIVLTVFLVIALTLLVVDVLNPTFGFFAKVDAGHVGVVEYFGDVRDVPLQPGFHFTNWFAHVRPISVRTERTSYQMEAFSSDIQQVILTVSVNLNVSEDSAGILYKKIGMKYQRVLVEPKLQENVKVVISKYTAESLIANRDKLSEDILKLMQDDISPYGINISGISIENIDFTDAFESAVEAKQVATQEKQRAKTLEEQKTMEAEQAAARKKLEAEAEASVKKTQADAEAYTIQTKANAEAEANKKLSESLTDKLIDYVQAQNWDGKLPSTYIGDGESIPVIQTATDRFWKDIENEDQ